MDMEQSQWQLTWDYYSSSLITPCSLLFQTIWTVVESLD